MRTVLAWAALACALALVGCNDAYVREIPFWSAWGYSESRIDDATYFVRYDGKPNANKEMADAFWFYRCAELTRNSGYEYFTASAPPPDFKPPVHSTELVRPQAFHPGGRGGGRLFKVRGHVVYHYYYVPTYSAGGTYTMWRIRSIVKMYHDPLPADVPYALNAAIVMAQYKAFIDAKGKWQPPFRDDVVKAAMVGNPRYAGYSQLLTPPPGFEFGKPPAAPSLPGLAPAPPASAPPPPSGSPGARRSPGSRDPVFQAQPGDRSSGRSGLVA